ncbi:hypothetical protein NDU88_009513 [Pleurodeles waltl]|uniref:Uncharacterized protein n=1 Tax=Pleurodeles waltl TaxID=8319 RepID=A0AAV7QRR6_PLEWA|nr:hypothetical protein NDU88_009513 [Pleurodeles waltl]
MDGEPMGEQRRAGPGKGTQELGTDTRGELSGNCVFGEDREAPKKTSDRVVQSSGPGYMPRDWLCGRTAPTEDWLIPRRYRRKCKPDGRH